VKKSREFPHEFNESRIPISREFAGIPRWEFPVALITAEREININNELTCSEWLRAAQLGQLRRGVLKFSEPPTTVGAILDPKNSV